jgi:Kef-type K+ transport system membrane component KefB
VIVPASGMPWRESLAVVVLMNNRGLVELVILNVGPDLHTISPTLFSMMVIMALTTTLMTTPLIDRILSLSS